LPRRDLAPSSEPVQSDDDLAREINTEHGHVETQTIQTTTNSHIRMPPNMVLAS
jgi:hypothetical protein